MDVGSMQLLFILCGLFYLKSTLERKNIGLMVRQTWIDGSDRANYYYAVMKWLGNAFQSVESLQNALLYHQDDPQSAERPFRSVKTIEPKTISQFLRRIITQRRIHTIVMSHTGGVFF